MELYKYVSENRMSIIKDGLIRFTQPQAFNDPFELKPYISTVAKESYIEELINSTFEKLIHQEYDNQPHQIKNSLPLSQYLAFAKSKRPEMLNQMQEIVKKVTPRMGSAIHQRLENTFCILSLTECPRNLLMWAHYANSHQGFVIEFDAEHEFFTRQKSDKSELRHVKKVQYTIQRPCLDLSKLTGIDEFLMKGKDWEYEQEWRILMELKDADKIVNSAPYNIHLFKVPFPAFKSIIIGARATNETKTKIKDIVQKNQELQHVKIVQFRIHDKLFELTT